MITIEQCRAARGLIGWTQQDLAEASGLSKTAINNYEKGHSDIKAESLRAIRMAFESVDIEFIGTYGLKQRSDHVEVLSGAGAMSELIDDICQSLEEDEELLVINTNPTEAPFSTEDLNENKIQMRSLFSEDSTRIGKSYRLLPATQGRPSSSIFVYKNKFAIELWDHSMILLVTSKDGAESQRELFERLWMQAKQVPDESSESAHVQSA